MITAVLIAIVVILLIFVMATIVGVQVLASTALSLVLAGVAIVVIVSHRALLGVRDHSCGLRLRILGQVWERQDLLAVVDLHLPKVVVVAQPARILLGRRILSHGMSQSFVLLFILLLGHFKLI